MAPRNNQPTVAEPLAIKARAQPVSMLYARTLGKAAAGDCFVQVGLTHGATGAKFAGALKEIAS